MKNSSEQFSQAPEIKEPELFSLTYREWQVLILLSADRRNPEIAEALFLSAKSVETYITRIGNKLGLNGRDKLSRTARRNNAYLGDFFKRYYANC